MFVYNNNDKRLFNLKMKKINYKLIVHHENAALAFD